ncbi:hypothetical protein [Actinoplanes sp. NPDC026670]|uniref:hypothetical protein n=1 Tax=Actinoplanes sp. NPDC026670 TaxID=3154700 RepID=UPI003408CA4E
MDTEIPIDARTLSALDTAGIAGLHRVFLAVDDNGMVLVDVLKERTGLIWMAEELAALLLATWVAHLIETNAALEAYLRDLIGSEPYIAVAEKVVVQALMTTAQAVPVV